MVFISEDKAGKKEKSVDTRIKSEVKRLNGILKKLPEDSKKAVKSLVENAAFMTVTLEDLQKTINENGVVTEYQNGENQWGTKKSPEVEIHLQMTKNHSMLMKQLTDLLPKGEPQSNDGFDDFVNSRS